MKEIALRIVHILLLIAAVLSLVFSAVLFFELNIRAGVLLLIISVLPLALDGYIFRCANCGPAILLYLFRNKTEFVLLPVIFLSDLFNLKDCPVCDSRIVNRCALKK